MRFEIIMIHMHTTEYHAYFVAEPYIQLPGPQHM